MLLENGKYEFKMVPGVVCPKLVCLRYGSAWREFVGDGAALALFQRCEALEARIAELREALVRISVLTKHEERSGYNHYCAKCVAEKTLVTDQEKP